MSYDPTDPGLAKQRAEEDALIRQRGRAKLRGRANKGRLAKAVSKRRAKRKALR